MDIFPLDGEDGGIGLFFVHGGGWKAGTRGVYHSIMREFARNGVECASTEYRLGPGELFAQISDVREGLRIFLADRAARSLSPKVVLTGCSAGAHLALMAALEPGGRAEFQENIVGVSIQAPALSFEPWEDIFPPIWQAMQEVVGSPYEDAPDLYQRASPMRCLHRDMPPVLILHAEYEHMFPLEMAQEFQRQAKGLGRNVEIKHYPRTEHGFFYSLDRWQQKQAFHDILAFIQSL